MGTKFYLGLRPLLTGTFYIHREGCPFMPQTDQRIFLGKFRNSHDAGNRVRILNKNTACCSYCSDGPIAGKQADRLRIIGSESDLTKTVVVQDTYDSALVCCIN